MIEKSIGIFKIEQFMHNYDAAYRSASTQAWEKVINSLKQGEDGPETIIVRMVSMHYVSTVSGTASKFVMEFEAFIATKK